LYFAYVLLRGALCFALAFSSFALAFSLWSDLRALVSALATIGSSSPVNLRYQPPSHLKKQSRLVLAPLPPSGVTLFF
jgi:hypothetical protein